MTVLKNSVLIATLATALFSTSAVMAKSSDTQVNNEALNATNTLVEQIFKPISGSVLEEPCARIRFPYC